MANQPADNGIPLDSSFSLTPPKDEGIPLDGSFSAAPDPVQNRDVMDRFTDAYQAAGQGGFPGLVARKYNQWFNTEGDQYVRQAFPGHDDAWYDNKKQELIGETQAGIRKQAEERQAADPAWRPDNSVMDNILAIDRWGPTVLGSMLGGMGPEAAVAPGLGGTAGAAAARTARIAGAAAVGALSDGAYQVADMYDKVKKEFSVGSMLASAAMGAGFQSFMEVPSFVRGLFKDRGIDTTPGANPTEDIHVSPDDVINTPEDLPQPKTMSPEDEAAYKNLLNTGSTEQILNFFKNRQGFSVNPSEVLSYVTARDRGQAIKAEAVAYKGLANDNGEPHVSVDTTDTRTAPGSNDNVSGGTGKVSNDNEFDLPKEGPVNDNEGIPLDDSFKSTPDAVAQEPIEGVRAPEHQEKLDATLNKVNELTENWENRPEIVVAHDASELPENIRQEIETEQGNDKGSKITGVRGSDGKVYILSGSLDHPDEAAGILYHEALGHQGLANKFNEDLSQTLDDFYNKGDGDFKAEVDDWLEKNPSAYKGAKNRHILAAEEVLAEQSENGTIKASMFDTLKNKIKDYGRQLGLDLKYSRREINTILAQAHNTVLRGTDSGATVLTRFKTRREQIKDATEALSDAKPGETKTTRPFPEDEPDYYRFRHVTDDGKPVTGMYTVNDGKIDNLSISSEGGAKSIGAKSIRQIGRDLLNEHDAKSISGYRISGAREKPDFVESGSRFSRKNKIPDSDNDNPIVLSDNHSHAELAQKYREMADYHQQKGIQRMKQGRQDHAETSFELARSFREDAAYFAKKALAPVEKPLSPRLQRLADRKAARERANNTEEQPTSKFARKKVDEEGNTINTHIGNTNLDRIDTLHDVDQFLRNAEMNTPDRGTVSHAETKQAARDLGIDYNKAIKSKSVGDLAAQITRLRQVQTDLLDRIAKFHEKMDTGDWTAADQVNLLSNMDKYNALHARVSDDKAQIARALSAMRITSRSNQKAAAILKALSENGGPSASLADRDIFERFAKTLQQHINNGNPQGANQLIVNTLKPYWEDYILTGRHAAMLSGLGTHYKNIMDNAANLSRDLQEHAVAAVAGGISKTEAGARAYGLWRALIDGQTWRDSLDALKNGHGPRQVNQNTKIEGANIPIAKYALNMLNAEDAFFRHFSDNMTLYGLGVREAEKNGLRGKAAFQKGALTARNPSPELLELAKKATDRLLLVDKPSALTSSIEQLKGRKPAMTPGERAIRFGVSMMFPFVRVSDRMIAIKMSRTPFALLSSKVRNTIMNGTKAERAVALSRIVYGTALLGWYAHNANQGNITPSTTSYKKTQSLQAGGYLPGAVKTKDGYEDATGVNTSAILNPLDFKNQTAVDVANLVSAYKKGGSVEDYSKGMAKALAKVVTEGSFADGLKPYVEAYGEATSDDNKPGSALNSLAASTASSFVPNIIRTANTSLIDKTKRDTTGDKSFLDTVSGRVKAGFPVWSKTLPESRDVIGDTQEQGRSFLTGSVTQKTKQDDVSKEIQRLDFGTDKPLLSLPNRTFKRDGVQIKMTGKDYSTFQQTFGQTFRASMAEIIRLPGWARADDNIRREVVKEVRAEAIAAAKDKLYPKKD